MLCPHVDEWSTGECNGKYLVCPMSGEEEETPDGDAVYDLYKDGLVLPSLIERTSAGPE